MDCPVSDYSISSIKYNINKNITYKMYYVYKYFKVCMYVLMYAYSVFGHIQYVAETSKASDLSVLSISGLVYNQEHEITKNWRANVIEFLTSPRRKSIGNIKIEYILL